MLYDMQCSTDACTRMYLCLRSYLIMGRDILIFAMAMSVGCSAALGAQDGAAPVRWRQSTRPGDSPEWASHLECPQTVGRISRPGALESVSFLTRPPLQEKIFSSVCRNAP